MQPALILTDSIVLSVIGAILLIIIGITGYFINLWIHSTELRDVNRDESNRKREDAMNLVLQNLTDTLVDVNLNLKVYQASMNGTLHAIKSSQTKQSDCLEKHDISIQDHEIRLTVIERR